IERLGHQARSAGEEEITDPSGRSGVNAIGVRIRKPLRALRIQTPQVDPCILWPFALHKENKITSIRKELRRRMTGLLIRHIQTRGGLWLASRWREHDRSLDAPGSRKG